MWIQPIYDRTQEDVDNKTSKGYLNIEDLNRIEGNVQELGNLLGLELSTIVWTHDTLPTKAQFDRILDNLTSIKERWVGAITIDNPVQPINIFDKVNVIERILYDVYKNYIEWNDSLIHCGEGYTNNADIL